MPYIYNRNLGPDEVDTGGRKGKPRNGGIEVFKAAGTVTSYKITRAAIKQVSETYNAHTTKDLLEALKLEDAKGAGNMLSELEEEGAFKKEIRVGSDPYGFSKEGVAGIHDHRTRARANKSVVTTSQQTTAKNTSRKV